MSTGPEHAQAAAAHLNAAEYEFEEIGETTRCMAMLRLSQGHALLAQVQFLREISDQLDSLPRRLTLNGQDILDALQDLDHPSTRPVVRG